MSKQETDFSKLMQKSKLQMPFRDFEDSTMGLIKLEAKYKRSIYNNASLSVVFFVLGIGVGLAVNIILMNSDTFFGVPTEKVRIPFQLGFFLIILTQLENLYRLFVKIKSKSPSL